MNVLGNTLDNNALAAMAQQAGPRVAHAIEAAATRTGVNFAYLMEQAAAESSFDADAGSSTSSAKGLYQFIEKTWLGMVKNHGHEYGMGKYAAMIDENGKVADPATRKEILALRDNPEKAALLAAAYASENQSYLERHSGLRADEIGSTELYLAHFLGAGGASAFLSAHKDNPLAHAADLFPKAARANRNVFYDAQTGEGRTLAGVYDFFAKKFQTSTENKMQVADANAGDSFSPPRTPAPVFPLRTVLAQGVSAHHPVLDFLSHPALPRLAPELSFGRGWQSASATQMLLLALQEFGDI